MDALKQYVSRNFEQFLVLLILLATVAITYFIPYKLAFLNFFFLPTILAAYYLGRNQAVMLSVFALTLVFLYILIYPDVFRVEQNTLVLYAQLVVWGGFLILAAAIVGRLRERLVDRVDTAEQLNVALEQSKDELEAANKSLRDYSENLELKVKERTVDLEQSRNAVEIMKRKMENALYATMDPTVVKLMIEGQLRNEKRNISVMFCDLTNFTSYSERHPPEVVIGELNRFLREVEPLIRHYHGHIDKYLGDGVMCEFGAPVDSVTYRTMAAVAAVKVQETMAASDFPWRARIGIASGPAFTGIIGFKRQTYTAIGDVVNLASRLETLCPPGGILVDAATYEGISHFIDGQRVAQVRVGGLEDPERERELQSLLAKWNVSPDDTELTGRIGMLHLALDEPADAIAYFERALRQTPDDTEIKLAYAEAQLKLKDESGGINVKGKSQRVEAFELVVGLRDPLLNRDKIPEHLYRTYAHVPELIKIPDQVILPVEVLDNSVGHSRVTAFLAHILATELGLPERLKQTVTNAAFLADIGKELIPQHILNRAGGLAGPEMEVVRQHPVEAANLLRKLGYEDEEMIEIVVHAREAINGDGYPHGLKGDEIPLGSRIVALANAYDALTSPRAYRESWARDAALEELERETARGVYDPQVMAALARILADPFTE